MNLARASTHRRARRPRHVGAIAGRLASAFTLVRLRAHQRLDDVLHGALIQGRSKRRQAKWTLACAAHPPS
eukprot:8543285-Ditylum_brightwellii.AAC.1